MSEGKPFLRWAGSKRRLIPHLRSYWRDDDVRYVEPFMGSAALFFALKPTSAVLSDTNAGLVEAFSSLREHPRAIYNRLVKLPLGEDAYYRIRKQDCKRLSRLDRVARFLYLNRFCFNGLYRTNQKGEFNVPYAGIKTARMPTWSEIRTAATALSSAEFATRDFQESLAQVRRGDFVYMDPPYAVENRRIFCQYGPATFGTQDLKRLAHSLDDIERRGAVFIVSYAMCEEALEVFGHWHVKRVRTQRSIAGFSQHRRNAIELIVSNREPTP